MDHLNSDLDHNSLGIFQRQLSDMLQSYQQLEHTEQPVAYTMLQSTLDGLQRSTLDGLQRSTLDGLQRSTLDGLQRSTLDGLQRSTLDGIQRSTLDGIQRSTLDGPPTGRSPPPLVFPVLASTRHLDSELAAARAPEAAGCDVSASLQNSSPAHLHDLLYHPQKQLVHPDDFGVSCRSLAKDFVMPNASAERVRDQEIEVSPSSVPAVYTSLKIPQISAVSVVSPAAAADDDVTRGVLQRSTDCPVQGSSAGDVPSSAAGGLSAGNVPSSAASGVSAGDVPSLVSGGLSTGDVPNLVSSGLSAGNVPSSASSGVSAGNVPSSASSGVNVGDMPSLASSGVNADNVPSSDDTRRRYVCPLPECNAERTHRKALVSHVRWEHTLSPLSCRNCRQQQATYAHHLYHSKHCYKGSNALTCAECGASFSLRLTYRRHMQGHAANNCSRCGLRLSSRKALVKHLRAQHGVRESERWFPCPECPRRFMKKHSLIYHSKVHATADATQCERCGLTLARTAVAAHMLQAHARQDVYRCPVCHKSFSRNQQYQQHRKLHERYTCATCGGSFASRLDYRRHISQTQPPHQGQLELSGAANSCATAAPAAVDAGAPPTSTTTVVRPPVRYLCQVCGASFWSPTRLSHHLKHHDTACLQCCRCGTDFTSAAELHRHLRRSVCARTPARLLCQHCGTHFTAHFLLRRHLLRSAHDGCPGTTNPSAASSVAMETDDVAHAQTTTSPPPPPPPPGELDPSTDVTSPVAVETDPPPQQQQQHLCEHCGHSCSSRSNLLRHVAAHWRQTRRRYVCDQCAAAFYTLSSLKDHQRYMHTVERTHVCRHCMKTFKTASSLNRHERSHSQQRPYQCFCGQDYKRMSHLRRHMEMTHQMRTKTRLVESLVEAQQPPEQQHEAEVVERGRPEEEAEGVVRVYSGDLREEDFTLPEGVYTTDTLMMPDGSRSIVLNPVQLPEDQQRLASHQLQQHHMMVLPVEQASGAAQPHLRHHQAMLTDHHHALDMVIAQPHQATEFMPAVIDGGQIALSAEFERDIEGAAVSHNYNQPPDGKDEPRPQRTSVVIRSLPPASSIRVHQ